MQGKWVLVDTDASHADSVGEVACKSYVTDSPQCKRRRITRNVDGTEVSRTGTAPFTELVDLKFANTNNSNDAAWFATKWTDVKIVTSTDGSVGSIAALYDAGNPPYLVVQSAGNGGTDYSWVNTIGSTDKTRVANAVTANTLIFVAGYSKDASGNYVRHSTSSGCKETEVSGGCLWALFEFPGVGAGTSLSAPNVSGAIASVLAVTPDTTPANLAKFAKACAKKTGKGIPSLLTQSGGVGVADFNCMGDVVSALSSLPVGGTTNVTINGQSITLRSREISLSFAGGNPYTGWPEEKESDTKVAFIPTGESTGLFAVTHRRGDLFASTAFGTRDDFFGFSDGHDEVRELNLSAGHRNLFATFSEQDSGGSDVISSARGRSLAFTAQERFPLTRGTSLIVSARTDHFLGGEADIPVGRINLDEGGWDNKLSLSSETEFGKDVVLLTSGSLLYPEGGDGGYVIHIGLRGRF